MIAAAKVVVMPVLPLTLQPISLFHNIWPLAGLAAGAIATLAWMGFLGYEFFELVVGCFSTAVGAAA